VMGDLEDGVFAGESFTAPASNTSLSFDYVTGMLKGNSGNSWALKAGNAQAGALTTMYSGARPKGYSPMKKEGAIVLGIGGDNSHTAEGTFFEGCITSGVATDATDAAIQANIVSAGYGSLTIGISDRQHPGDREWSVRQNPSNGDVSVDFATGEVSQVRLRALDLQGREVASLRDGPLAAGEHREIWNTRSTRTGIYAIAMDVDGVRTWSRSVVVGR